MNTTKKFAYDRALSIAATNPKEAFRLLLASDDGQEDQGQEEQKTAADMGLDPSQEELYDALMIIAENDGNAYRKRDATMAVNNAWKEWKQETDANLREDFRSIQKKLVKALDAQWKKYDTESR